MNQGLRTRNLLAVLGVALVALAVCASCASATEFGELTRFGARQEQLTSGTMKTGVLAGKAKERESDEFFVEGPEINYGIGVDPSEGNAVFVLDEPVEPEETELNGERDSVTRHVRIQKFNPANGEVTASRTFTVTSPSNELESSEEIEPEEFSNIAVDTEKGVLYVLSEEPRKFNTKKDLEAPVATTLFAFSTATLEPAPNAKAEGVLDGSTELEAESTTAGKALIEPRGITVDPKSHEVIILAHEDEAGEPEDDIGKAKDHFVLQRISEKGVLGERYVDKKNFFKTSRIPAEYPSSPVVNDEGHVLVRFGTEGITEVPSGFAAATKAETEPKALYTRPEGVHSVEESEVEAEAGGGLSLSPEGTLYEPSSVVNSAEVEKAHDNGLNWAVSERTDTDAAMLGWVGGESASVSEEAHAGDKCVLQPSGSQEPEPDVAAGSGGDVFVLSPAFFEVHEEGEPEFVTTKAVIELGPGGKGCPKASAGPIGLYEAGVPLGAGETVEAGNEVELSTKLGQADALAAEWTLTNETTHEAPIVEKPDPLEFRKEETGLKLQLLQQPNLKLKFTTAGEYVVTAKIHTDDRTSEEVEPKSLKVTVVSKSGTPSPPNVTRQPASTTVTEPARATFTAEASGTPKPKVQWQTSSDKGKTWTDVSGATSDTLTLENTTVAESGHEYRAEFVNEHGTAISNAATLTVKEKTPESPPSGPSNPSGPESPPANNNNPPPSGGVLPHIETKPPVSSPDATVASSGLSVSAAGVLTLQVKCPAGETSCTGTVTLRTLTAVSARASAAKAKRAILTLASGSFTVAGGAEQTVKLHLSAAARKLLAHSHTLRARATLSAHDPAGASHTDVQVVTLHLVKR